MNFYNKEYDDAKNVLENKEDYDIRIVNEAYTFVSGYEKAVKVLKSEITEFMCDNFLNYYVQKYSGSDRYCIYCGCSENSRKHEQHCPQLKMEKLLTYLNGIISA